MVNLLNIPPFGDYSWVKDWSQTGSSYICNPPVTDTDVDYAVLVKDLAAPVDDLITDGWEVTLDDPTYTITINQELPFITARKAEVNLIIFDREEAFIAFYKATEVARRLNLTNKEDRVALFQAVCWGRGTRTVEYFL